MHGEMKCWVLLKLSPGLSSASVPCLTVALAGGFVPTKVSRFLQQMFFGNLSAKGLDCFSLFSMNQNSPGTNTDPEKLDKYLAMVSTSLLTQAT